MKNCLEKSLKSVAKSVKIHRKIVYFFLTDIVIDFCMFLDCFLMDFERENGTGESVFFEVFRAWSFGLFRHAAQDPQGLLSGRLGLAV